MQHLCYFSLDYAENPNSIEKLFALQKTSLQITYLRNHDTNTSPLFRESSILKLPDKIVLETCLFINKYFIKFLPTIFKNLLIQYSLVQSSLRCYTSS